MREGVSVAKCFSEAIFGSMQYVQKATPIISKLLGGRTIAVEGDDNEVCKLLDMQCGIDYLQVHENGLVVGIASRFQDYPNMRTFTVRNKRESGAKTEMEKRQLAIKHRFIYPALTMQGYVQKGDIVGIGITSTRQLLWFVERGYAKSQHTGEDQKGQAAFWVCRWDDMRNHGIKVLEWP